MNPADGSVWVPQLANPDLPSSHNRLHVVEPDGRVRLQIELGDWGPGYAAVDADRGVAWLTGGGGDGWSLRKMELASWRVLGEFPVAGDLCVDPDTGCVWVVAREAVYRLASTGEPIRARPTGAAGMAAGRATGDLPGTGKVVRLVPPTPPPRPGGR